jgi:hypothetical protein
MAIEAPVIAALVTGAVSLVTSGLVAVWVTRLKALLDNRTLFQAERVAHELLMMPAWNLRTFKAIKHHLGFEDDNKIREVLIRAGALRFERKGDGAEMWGLLERNRHLLQQKPEAAADTKSATDIDDTG